MNRSATRPGLVRFVECLALIIGLVIPVSAWAEVNQLRISRGFGAAYLPLYVMDAQGLVQKHAAAAGLGDVKVEYLLVDGGNHINDAMLAGTLDIASIGTGGYLVMWAKTKGNAKLEVIGLGAAGLRRHDHDERAIPRSNRCATSPRRTASPCPASRHRSAPFSCRWPPPRNSATRTMPGSTTLTVGLPYPDAVAAMLSGRSEITAHMASPPFSFIELDSPGHPQGVQLRRCDRTGDHHHGVHDRSSSQPPIRS